MSILIVIRDALIAMALAWVGVQIAPAEREAPACQTGQCASTR